MPSLVAVAVEPVVFFLGDAWRRRVLVLGGGVLFACALAVAASAGALWLLLVAFAVLAPASGGFVSLSQATLMDAEPARREVNMTRWTIAGAVGALGGPAVLTAAVVLGVGWRGAFLACAGVAAVMVAVGAARVSFAPRVAEARPRLRDVGRALTRPGVVRWLVALQTANLLLDVLLTFVALYVVDDAGGSTSLGALTVLVWTAAGLVGGIGVLRLLRRVSGLVYLQVSAGAALVLFPAFLLVPGAPAKLAILALLGVTNAGWYPVLKARLYAALPQTSGIALMLGSATELPASFTPLALGLIAERWGLDTALWLLLMGPVALLVLVPRRDPLILIGGGGLAPPQPRRAKPRLTDL